MITNLSAADQLAYCTVRLECQLPNGLCSIGSGFFFNFLGEGDSGYPCIITNKHVVDGAETASMVFHVDDGNRNPREKLFHAITFDNLQVRALGHPDPDVDLCAIPVGQTFNKVEADTGHRPIFITLDRRSLVDQWTLQSMNAVEDVLMVGYPSGLWDSANNLPIFRKGITASHPAKNFEDRREFMIDMPCFHGSSGSPVFLFNTAGWTTNDGAMYSGQRSALLGVLSSGPILTAEGEIKIVKVPTVRKKKVVLTELTMNLGYAIKADRILEIEPVVSKFFEWFNRQPPA